MKTIAFMSLCFVLALGVDLNVNDFKFYGVAINRITIIEATGVSWAVGDNGQVFKLNDTGVVVDHPTLPAGSEYNLNGVSFATGGVYGYIVGYKRGGSDKWKGGIWKTTNGGQSWNPQTNIIPPFDIPTPFLDVTAEPHDAQGRGVVWVSCGHGEVLRTTDGGFNWTRKSKPGGENHFGWLWGLWSDYSNPDYAWVCSDQSGLIAMTTNGGDSWTNYVPAESDSLAYFDIDYSNNKAV
jgi:photosystem II stability/assembly factor-like uncharacterized protein